MIHVGMKIASIAEKIHNRWSKFFLSKNFHSILKHFRFKRMKTGLFNGMDHVSLISFCINFYRFV